MEGFFEHVLEWMGAIIGVLWGTHTFVVLLGLGIALTVWSKFIQYRALTHGVQVLRGKYDDKRDPGAINHFQALSAALSGTVGLGNIGGVALAIGIGGPGALFWMWVTGFLGMAIKSVEVTLSMIYRDTSIPDNPHGGAMYVIKRGFGDRVGGAARPVAWAIGALFCVTLLISTVTGGNMFQAWNVADITNQYFGIPQVLTGIVLATLTGLVILGGIKRIGEVAGKLVPVMCGMYLVGGLVILVLESANVPALLAYVVRDAFSPTEAGGAFLGASAWFGLTVGLRRALFSNEAGQGSSPIAHSAAKTDEPVREGVVAGLEPFIDTCIVCTLTALVILATGTWNRQAVAPFAGELRLVQVGDPGATNWTIEGPVTLDHLPPLPSPDSWARGNGFFLLAEVPGNRIVDTASNRIKIGGTIVAAAGDDRGAGYSGGDLIIRWNTIDLGDHEWERPPTELRLVDAGVYRDFTGAALTAHAFDRSIPGMGKWLVTLTCWLFALSTMISWSYYGEQGVVFLVGERGVTAYKVLFCLLAVVATFPQFIKTDRELGDLADLGTGCMLFANVPIVITMAYQAIRAFNDYFARMDRGDLEPPHKAPPITEVVSGEDVQ